MRQTPAGIQPIAFKVMDCEFHSHGIERLTESFEFNLEVSAKFDNSGNSGNTRFLSILNAELKGEETPWKLNVTYYGLFRTEIELNKDFLESHFVTVNAPAIVFPFLRSFIASFLANSGYGIILLPAINFEVSSRENN